jgi:hypothetical protein
VVGAVRGRLRPGDHLEVLLSAKADQNFLL